MPLKEIRNGEEKVYQDDDILSQAQLARIFEVSPMSVHGARKSAHLQFVKSFRVSDLPRLMKGFKNKRSGRNGHRTLAHSWAQIKDLDSDFEVRLPSGAKLIYEYKKPA